jgi:hypothetical protein
MNFKKGTSISAGNFLVSIGTFNLSDVAIISKSSGEFVTLSMTKRSKKLRLIKRRLKCFLSCDQTFNFQHMTEDKTQELIDILKSK